jgi:hypothetical protein
LKASRRTDDAGETNENERKEVSGMAMPRSYRETQADGLRDVELACPYRARLPERTDGQRAARRARLQPTTAKLRAALRPMVDELAYRHWLAELAVIDAVDDELFIEAPARSARWVRERYGHLIATAAARLAGRRVAVFVVAAAPVPFRPVPVVAEPAGAVA